MATVLLVCVVILVVAALVFGIVSLLTGEDPGLAPVEPDGRALPLPNHRSLAESDLKAVRFDVTLRGYRMAQVDRALRRTAYDVGYKDEMIAVLEAEVAALREGRLEDADLLRKAREAAANPDPASTPGAPAGTADPDELVIDLDVRPGDGEDESEAGPRSDVSPAIGATPTLDDAPKIDTSPAPVGDSVEPTPAGESVEPADGSARTHQDDSAYEPGRVAEAYEPGRVADAYEPGRAAKTDEAGRASETEEAGATTESEEATGRADSTAVATGDAPAPAARSAPKKTVKRPARA
jgi:DivIVA domain-containing protein